MFIGYLIFNQENSYNQASQSSNTFCLETFDFYSTYTNIFGSKFMSIVIRSNVGISRNDFANITSVES